MPNIHETVKQMQELSMFASTEDIESGGPGSGRKPGSGNKFVMTPAQHKMHTKMSKRGYTKIGGLSKEGHAVYQRPNGTQKHIDQQGNVVKTKFFKDNSKNDLI